VAVQAHMALSPSHSGDSVCLRSQNDGPGPSYRRGMKPVCVWCPPQAPSCCFPWCFPVPYAVSETDTTSIDHGHKSLINFSHKVVTASGRVVVMHTASGSIASCTDRATAQGSRRPAPELAPIQKDIPVVLANCAP
jgi:hypothetical protein